MSLGILRRFLNLAASNTKSIELRRFLNTAASNSKPIHNGNGKLEGGSQCAALVPVSQRRDFVLVHDASEIEINKRRGTILMVIAVASIYELDELLSKADAEDLRRKIMKKLPKDENNRSKEFMHKNLERLKMREEEAEEKHKLLLKEIEELMEELKREKTLQEIFSLVTNQKTVAEI